MEVIENATFRLCVPLHQFRLGPPKLICGDPGQEDDKVYS